MLERYAADMKELIGTASEENSGKGPGDFSKRDNQTWFSSETHLKPNAV